MPISALSIDDKSMKVLQQRAKSEGDITVESHVTGLIQEEIARFIIEENRAKMREVARSKNRQARSWW
jgi:hypothetical protein